MSLESEIENQPFAVRRVVLASGWRQGLTSLFPLVNRNNAIYFIYTVHQTIHSMLVFQEANKERSPIVGLLD